MGVSDQVANYGDLFILCQTVEGYFLKGIGIIRVTF